MSAHSKGAAIVAALAVGALAYKLQGKPADCTINGVPVPGSTQTLLDGLRGAASHTGEDLIEGMLAGGDLLMRIETLGLATPTGAAEFYAWWHGLTPDQQRAAADAENNGGLTCAAGETAQQLATGASALMVGAVAGAIAYFAVEALDLGAP